MHGGDLDRLDKRSFQMGDTEKRVFEELVAGGIFQLDEERMLDAVQRFQRTRNINDPRFKQAAALWVRLKDLLLFNYMRNRSDLWKTPPLQNDGVSAGRAGIFRTAAGFT